MRHRYTTETPPEEVLLNLNGRGFLRIFFARNNAVPSSMELHNYLEKSLVKPPRCDTQALSPAGRFGKIGAAPLSGVKKANRTRHQRLYTARLLTSFENCGG
jgi:hypothetical protein